MQLLGMIPLNGLLPLEGTMPGWPEAPEVSIAPTIFMALGIPLIIALIIIVLGKGKELRQGAVENGVAVGLPASNQPIAIEGTRAEDDLEDAMAIETGTPDNQTGSSSA